MKCYESPMILLNEELAEGVYAASGASTGGGISYSVSLIEAGNQYNKVNKYNVAVTNNGSEKSGNWSVTLQATGTIGSVTIYNGWQASAAANGNQITITPGGGGAIEAGNTINIELVVSYTSDGINVK